MKKTMRSLLTLAAAWGGMSSLQAEFLFAPTNPTPNGLFTPTLDYGSMVYEYSAWDVFYAPHTAGNYPDKFAPYGGIQIGGLDTPDDYSDDTYAPVTRSSEGFAPNTVYNPSDPLAFWDTRNAQLTQYGATSAMIIGPEISGNIYTYSQKTRFRIDNSPDYGGTGTGTVIMQFQTDGNTMDFSGIKLVYNDGFNDIEIYATEAEYLREYANSGSSHWSASAGYSNRVAIQWDLSGLTDQFGNAISSYQIFFDANSSSVSLQKLDLITADTYQAGIPISAAWVGGEGSWSNSANWQLHANSGLSMPQENGNIKFQNAEAVTLEIDDADHAIGELIFESAEDVTIRSTAGHALISNTGVATREGATGTYSIDTDFVFGALNFFEINDGTVVMNGVLSGGYGMVKSGEGTLVLANNNTFTGFLGVQDGTVRIEGTNAYTGSTTIVNGRVIVAGDAGATGALGSTTSDIALGGDASLYQYVAVDGDWMAELFIEGDHEISRNITLAPGDFGKRLGVTGTGDGAVFSGNIKFTGTSADPDSTDSAAGNVYLTATSSTDRMIVSGEMTGGHTSKTLTLDGEGTVVYTGTNKTYNNATRVAAGTLLIEGGSSLTGNGAVTVDAAARLEVASGSSISGSGDVTLDGGILKIDGSLAGSGNLLLNSGMLTGAGNVQRAFTVGNGVVLSPGNSPGQMQTVSQTWDGGGTYLWEIGNLAAGAGTGWDFLNITGGLTIMADGSDRFTLQLVSLDAFNEIGLLDGFDNMAEYSWVIASASAGITGFSEDAFLIDVGGFENALSGSFSVSIEGNDLILNYAPVPEPTTFALIGIGLLAILSSRRRRARTAQDHAV